MKIVPWLANWKEKPISSEECRLHRSDGWFKDLLANAWCLKPAPADYFLQKRNQESVLVAFPHSRKIKKKKVNWKEQFV